MHLSIVLNRLLFLKIEEQVTVVEQEVIITNNNLLFYFSGDNSGCLYTRLLLSKT